MNNHLYFKMYASCVPVLGATRSTVCDLQREKFYFIPNALCEVLIDYADKTLEQIKKVYNNEVDGIIEEYFQFLIDKELGFFTDEPEMFPSLDLSWKFPATITNAIIDVDEQSDHGFPKIFRELDQMNCKAIQIRFYDEIALEKLLEIIELTENSRLEHMELLLKYTPEMKTSSLTDLCNRFHRVGSITVHSSPDFKTHPVSIEGLYSFIFYIKEAIDSSSHCGIVHLSNFKADLKLFTESQKFNSCLNRKISVDVNGDIKNCPTLEKSFGNIKKQTFAEALEHPEFKALWTINKDQVEVCKDCEFRYICTDCRALIENPDNVYSKPAKCSYDPYSASWGNPEDDPNHKYYLKFLEGQGI